MDKSKEYIECDKETKTIECSKFENNDTTMANYHDSSGLSDMFPKIQDHVVFENSHNTLEYAKKEQNTSSSTEYRDNLIINEHKMEITATQDSTQETTQVQSNGSNPYGTITHPSLTFENIKLLTGVWAEFYPKKGQLGDLPVFLKGCKW